MEYILSAVFGQTLARYGAAAAMAALVVFAVVAVVAYYLKARVDLMRQEAVRKDQEAGLRDQERLREIESREGERRAMIGELAATRGQVNTFLTNHLAHLAEERKENQKVMGDICKALQEQTFLSKAITDDIKAHREEEGERAGRILGKIEDLRLDVAKGG